MFRKGTEQDNGAEQTTPHNQDNDGGSIMPASICLKISPCLEEILEHGEMQCSHCEEQIFGPAYKLMLKVDTGQSLGDSGIVLCSSCCDLVQIEEKRS